MATWQPSVNSGGFLGSIGQFNDNAPRASDANPVINSINQSNELARSGANNMGLQALNGLVGLAGIYQENKAKERLGEFQKAWGEAYANSDRDGMRQLLATYPEYAQAITGGMQGVSADVRESLGNLSSGYRNAVMNGNATDYVRQNADTFRRLGIDPMEAVSIAEKDPKAAVQLADHIGMSSLGIDDYFNLQDKQLGRQIDQGRLDEQIRSNQAGEAITSRRDEQANARGWASVNIQQQNADIAKSRLQLDMDLKRAETENKVIERQLAQETNELKRDELKLRLQESNNKIEQVKADRTESISSQVDSANRAIKTAQGILDSKGFSGYFGVNMNPFGNRYIPGTDAADTGSMVDTLKSQGFLAGVQQMKGMGGLSDAEGKKITDAIGSLDPNMSEKQARTSINNIIDVFNEGKKRIERKYPEEYSKYLQDQGGGNSNSNQSNTNQVSERVVSQNITEGTTATNPKTGQKIIFRGGQWQPI